MSLGTISSFTLSSSALYACYVRAAYCTKQGIVSTPRIEGRINLKDSVTRSLKDLGIPEGANVQLVVELVAAGNPTVISKEVYTFSEDSFRTASYKCSGTVFNPHLERVVRRPPPPPTMPMTYGTMKEMEVPGESSIPLLAEKQECQLETDDKQAREQRCSWLCC